MDPNFRQGLDFLQQINTFNHDPPIPFHLVGPICHMHLGDGAPHPTTLFKHFSLYIHERDPTHETRAPCEWIRI